MIPTFTALSKLSLPWKLWSVRVDLREHEDKILLRLSLVVSAIVGLVVVAFVVLTERLGVLLLTAGAVQRVLSPLVGSLVGGWLLFRFFPDARGSGIPQTRVALVLQKGVIGLRTVIGKFVCSSISLGSGVALGREGPSVHTNSPSMAYGTRLHSRRCKVLRSSCGLDTGLVAVQTQGEMAFTPVTRTVDRRVLDHRASLLECRQVQSWRAHRADPVFRGRQPVNYSRASTVCQGRAR